MPTVKSRPGTKAAEKKVATSNKGVSKKATSSSASTSGTSKKTPPKTTAARGKVAGKTAAPSAKSKAAPKSAAKSAPRKKAAPKVAPPAVKRELNELGFMDGSDSATIARCLVEGGADRQDVNNIVIAEIEKSTGLTNRNGEEKYIPSMVSGILGRMLKTGQWEIHASWQLVPVEAPAKKVARKRTAKG